MGTYQIERRELSAQVTAVVRATLAVREIKPFIGRVVGAVADALARQGISPTGPPFARYHRAGHGVFDVEAGLPAGDRVAPTGEVVASVLPGGPAAAMIYVGPYDEMEDAYRSLAKWIADNGAISTGDPWEVYLTNPAEEPDPQRWRTEIVMPYTT